MLDNKNVVNLIIWATSYYDYTEWHIQLYEFEYDCTTEKNRKKGEVCLGWFNLKDTKKIIEKFHQALIYMGNKVQIVVNSKDVTADNLEKLWKSMEKYK